MLLLLDLSADWDKLGWKFSIPSRAGLRDGTAAQHSSVVTLQWPPPTYCHGSEFRRTQRAVWKFPLASTLHSYSGVDVNRLALRDKGVMLEAYELN